MPVVAMSLHDPAMLTYYAQRSREYERVYDKPERRQELAWLGGELPRRVDGCLLLELACGTGYWTRRLAASAGRVVAIDRSREVLDLARRSVPPPVAVDWVRADALAPPFRPKSFDVCFAGFFWSHVARRMLDGWLRAVAGQLRPGGRVLVLDNRYVEGSSTPIARVDEFGDSWQERRLENGSVHRVRKNFPTEGELRDRMAALGAVLVELTAHYWLATVTVAS